MVAFTYGIKPAIIAIILGAALPLARRTVKTWTLGLLGAAVFGAILLGLNEIYAMFGAGLVTLAFRSGSAKMVAPLWKIFFLFLKIGAILYGSGYVLFRFPRPGIGGTLHLLSRQTLTDAIAVGPDSPPGPRVFFGCTFIGWQMQGLPGAAVATVAIFLPSFLLVALLNPLVPRMRTSVWFSAFLDGINVASLAIILVVCVTFSRETLTGWKTILIAAASLIVVFGFPKVNNAWLVLGSALTGYFLMYI